MDLQQILSEVQFLTPSVGAIVAGVMACLLLFASGFASGSEIAFFSLSPVDLNELDETDERDRKIMRDAFEHIRKYHRA
jgi:CBS domain containing-hemolysin-like protein